MVRSRLIGATLALAALGTWGGCAVAQSRPPPSRPITNIAREEGGQVVSVRDTQIDLSTHRSRGLTAHAPAVPVGPVGIRLPVTIGGEKAVLVPAEEITVRLTSNGKMISIVQELSSPPFAPGERVRILYERTDDGSSQGRMQVVRAP